MPERLDAARQREFALIDAMTPELRALVYEYGFLKVQGAQQVARQGGNGDDVELIRRICEKERAWQQAKMEDEARFWRTSNAEALLRGFSYRAKLCR